MKTHFFSPGKQMIEKHGEMSLDLTEHLNSRSASPAQPTQQGRGTQDGELEGGCSLCCSVTCNSSSGIQFLC